ncbi:Pyridoxal phosphate-dependent transferase, major domain protein, partial [Metarhizium majus ARSEF 297]
MTYNVEAIRVAEYPMLQEQVYLDHAGATICCSSAIEEFQEDMSKNVYGNPHSKSQSSKLSTRQVERVRNRALGFFNASSDDFDIIFVQNATAGVKLVAEILQCNDRLSPEYNEQKGTLGINGFWCSYHMESHTSLLGLRQLAKAGSVCFENDKAVQNWLKTGGLGNEDMIKPPGNVGIFTYPGQSNMSGRRLPLTWSAELRQSNLPAHTNMYTLFDAAALASTSELDFTDADKAPDFTVLSFYKIFGFPDLGCLIIRRAVANILEGKQYFGGGTVEMAVNTGLTWHSFKRRHPHEFLEDGTVPFHNIIALGHALTAHQRLYKSQSAVSEHVSGLTKYLFGRLSTLCHGNGRPICTIYKDACAEYGDSRTQGPIIAFNIRDIGGRWLRLSELEKAATKSNIHLRTGDVCNPGGVATSLGLAPWELFRNYAAGIRCGCRNIVIGGKPSGIARVSLGAMSTIGEANTFITFIESNFLDLDISRRPEFTAERPLYVNTVIIYPIIGCSGWRVPHGTKWNVGPSGLHWDRYWCLIDTDKRTVLTTDEVPHLVLLHPEIDKRLRLLKVKLHRSLVKQPRQIQEIRIPVEDCSGLNRLEVSYRGVMMTVQAHKGQPIVTFLSAAMNRRCTIARVEYPEYYEGNDLVKVENAMVIPHADAGMTPTGETLMTQMDEKTAGYSFADSLRPPQEVLAESMGANIVLSATLDVSEPKLDDQWTFVNLGRRYVEASSGSGQDTSARGREATQTTSFYSDTQTYYIARVTRDTLPIENLCLEVPSQMEGLYKIRCSAKDGPLLPHKDEWSEIHSGQRWVPD